MDDQQLIATLRAVAPTGDPRPAFVEELHADLEARLGMQPTAVAVRPRASRRGRIVLLAATIALLAALAAGAVLVGGALRLLVPPVTTLDLIRDTGAMRVAVGTDAPQATTAQGSLDGFDLGVARLLASRLGVQAHLQPSTVDSMLAGTTPDWQVALPSRSLTRTDLERFAASDPYYAWPLYLVTLAATPGPDPTGIGAGPICAASGSAAERWLTGDASEFLEVLQASPARPDVHLVADDAGCLDEVRQGTSEAMVTSRLLAAELAASPDLRVIGDGPVAREPRGIVVPRSSAGEAELIAELDRIIGAARVDGSLAALSREYFGGEDLTVVPR